MAKSKNLDSFNGFTFGAEETATATTPTAPKATRGKGRPKEEREVKKRISLAVLPSVYEDIGKIAYVDRVSISEIVTKVLEEYRDKNKAKIAEYDRLKK